MGNNQQRGDDATNFKESDWIQIPNYSYTNNRDPYYSSNFTVLQNKENPYLQLQRYQLYFNSITEYRSYFQSYVWRAKNKFLVTAKYCKEKSKKFICSTFHQASIFIERIPIRVCQITQTPIDQGLYMIYCCIQGYRKIYQKTGYFQVNSNMIGINRQCKVKVWPNINFSKNFPQFCSMNQNKNQGDFIINLIKVCQSAIDFCDDLPFSDYLNNSLSKDKLKRLNFDEALVQLQFYVKSCKFVIARQMKSIRQLLKNKSHKQQIKQSVYRGKSQSKEQFKNNENSSQNFDNNFQNKNYKDKKYYFASLQNQNIKAKNFENISPLMLSPSDSLKKIDYFDQNKDRSKHLNTKRKKNLSKYFYLRDQVTQRSNNQANNAHSFYIDNSFTNFNTHIQDSKNRHRFESTTNVNFYQKLQKIKRRGPSVSFAYKNNNNTNNFNPYFSPQNGSKLNQFNSSKLQVNDGPFLKQPILNRQRSISTNFPKNLYVQENDFIVKNKDAFKKTSPTKNFTQYYSAKTIENQRKQEQACAQDKTYFTLTDKCEIDQDIAQDLRKFKINFQEKN